MPNPSDLAQALDIKRTIYTRMLPEASKKSTAPQSARPPVI
jgi:hypothetical protein